MAITFNSGRKTFHLKSKDTSYIFYLNDKNDLIHIYWGKRLSDENILYSDLSFEIYNAATPYPEKPSYSYEAQMFEYSFGGSSDFRNASFEAEYEDGSTASEIKYKSHKIVKGKSKLKDLPATYVENDDEADTLLIEMVEQLSDLKIIMQYSVYKDLDLITRSVCFINEGNSDIYLNKAMSVCIDFSHSNFKLLTLPGAWSREREINIESLSPGTKIIDSCRGISSHQFNPFVAMLNKESNEDYGNVYAASLVYSGNFMAQIEVDHYDTLRFLMGINDHNLRWKLSKNESFQTPEALLVFSGNGLGEISRKYHEIVKTRL